MARRRTIALFTGDGRLGNQMFEAAYLDGVLQPGDRVFTTGMEELLEGFVWERMEIRNRRDTRAHQSAKRWFRRLGRMAVKLRLVSGIRQTKRIFETDGGRHALHGDEVLRTDGVFSRALYVDKGYFQNAELAARASFRLKEDFLKSGRAFLDGLPPGPRAFVHVRRGDYRNWAIFGRSPLLPLDYFARGVALIREAAPQTQFILLSDEADAVVAEMGEHGMHVFRGANVYEDFGLMTLCDGGVVSNSTLSWWGGYFCGRKLPVVSPRGWLAAGLGFEYPLGITASWMTPIEP